jgi:formate dehydrogenase iron-sulfur subunit
VDELPFLARQQRLIFARAGRTEPLSLDAYAAHGGWRGLRAAAAAAAAEVRQAVLASGLRGRGGAAFPAGIKWRTVGEAAGPRKHVVCNADEGDSGTYADRMVMEGDPFLLIEGMAIAGIACGATTGIVYVRSEYRRRSARCARRSIWHAGPDASVPTSPAPVVLSSSRCASVPAPTCAARKRRCSRASRAGAAWCAPSRPCRPSPACSDGRR